MKRLERLEQNGATMPAPRRGEDLGGMQAQPGDQGRGSNPEKVDDVRAQVIAGDVAEQVKKEIASSSRIGSPSYGSCRATGVGR